MFLLSPHIAVALRTLLTCGYKALNSTRLFITRLKATDLLIKLPIIALYVYNNASDASSPYRAKVIYLVVNINMRRASSMIAVFRADEKERERERKRDSRENVGRTSCEMGDDRTKRRSKQEIKSFRKRCRVQTNRTRANARTSFAERLSRSVRTNVNTVRNCQANIMQINERKR